MKAYYFGTIIFGKLVIDFLNAEEDLSPIALIQSIDEVKDFETEDEAFLYAEDLGVDYIQVKGAIDEQGQEYQLAFLKY